MKRSYKGNLVLLEANGNRPVFEVSNYTPALAKYMAEKYLSKRSEWQDEQESEEEVNWHNRWYDDESKEQQLKLGKVYVQLFKGTHLSPGLFSLQCELEALPIASNIDTILQVYLSGHFADC